MKIHSPPEKITSPNLLKIYSWTKKGRSLPHCPQGQWAVAVSFGHQTCPKMHEKGGKRLCYVDHTVS